MTCDEFRERCHILLDERDADRVDEQMLAHMGGCQACADFRGELLTIDATLRQIPVSALPASLVDSLSRIGESRDLPSIGWGPDVGRAARYLIPGLLLWWAQWAFPENLRPYYLASVVFVWGFIFITSVLRPGLPGTPES
jgi:hypothetical protein